MVQAYSIGNAAKCVDPNFKHKKFVPGVGAYDTLKTSSVDKKSPSYSLPRAVKIKEALPKKFTVPGVGQYDVLSPKIHRRVPSYHVALKTESQFDKFLRKEKRPGPAEYDPFRSSLSKIAYTMRSKNDLLEKS